MNSVSGSGMEENIIGIFDPSFWTRHMCRVLSLTINRIKPLSSEVVALYPGLISDQT